MSKTSIVVIFFSKVILTKGEATMSPCCPSCENTVFSSAVRAVPGGQVLLTYCVNCGVVVGAVNKPS